MFPERLKQLRKDRKITQKQLAQKLLVDQTAISYWEQGKTKPDLDNQIKLADFFGVSTDYLLGRTDTQKSGLSEDIEIIAIQRAAQNMSDSDKKRMLQMLKLAFEEAFEDEE